MKSIIFIFILVIFGLSVNGNPDLKSQTILYVFEGSDWCTNCARLEKKILTDSTFKREISLLKIKVERIDFPQRKKLPSDLKTYNDRIAEKFGFDGTFPTLILFRTDTDRSAQIYYHNESVEEMLRMIHNNMELLYE